MAVKSYDLTHADGDTVPLSSFIDEFKITNFDPLKLCISVDIDHSDCYYVGDTPTVCVVIEYDEPSA